MTWAMNGSTDSRLHFYVARCEDCPKWIHLCDKAPMRAHNLARKHSVRCPGHTTVVINLTTLEAVHTYHLLAFDADDMTGSDDPPF